MNSRLNWMPKTVRLAILHSMPKTLGTKEVVMNSLLYSKTP